MIRRHLGDAAARRRLLAAGVARYRRRQQLLSGPVSLGAYVLKRDSLFMTRAS